MKHTVIPKVFALLLSGLLFLTLDKGLAACLSLGVWIACFGLLTIPVLNPRSNFYGPTLSRARSTSESHDQRAIALTFDDGPDPRFTPSILDLLDLHDIKATFFVVGTRAAQNPDLIQEIVRRGHLIGNHSHTHGLNFHFKGPGFYRREFADFDSTLMASTGKRCRYFRPPQGIRTPILATEIERRGLLCISWTARGFDSVRTSSEAIRRSLRDDLSPGAVIMLHDGGGLGGRKERAATLEVLPLLIADVRERGLSFQALDELLGEPAYF